MIYLLFVDFRLRDVTFSLLHLHIVKRSGQDSSFYSSLEVLKNEPKQVPYAFLLLFFSFFQYLQPESGRWNPKEKVQTGNFSRPARGELPIRSRRRRKGGRAEESLEYLCLRTRSSMWLWGMNRSFYRCFFSKKTWCGRDALRCVGRVFWVLLALSLPGHVIFLDSLPLSLSTSLSVYL